MLNHASKLKVRVTNYKYKSTRQHHQNIQ